MRGFRIGFVLVLLFALALTACGGAATRNPDNANPMPPLATAPRATVVVVDELPTVAPTNTRRAPTATRVSSINGFKTITRAELPPEANKTLSLIQRGGPFPYRQDGQVFQNREGILPKKQSGYYHEYTVETPGSDDRGARRIVTGAQNEYYYTSDHYASFKMILDP